MTTQAQPETDMLSDSAYKKYMTILSIIMVSLLVIMVVLTVFTIGGMQGLPANQQMGIYFAMIMVHVLIDPTVILVLIAAWKVIKNGDTNE